MINPGNSLKISPARPFKQYIRNSLGVTNKSISGNNPENINAKTQVLSYEIHYVR
jgi:hypothetical protein